MDNLEKNLLQLLQRAQERERISRRRALIFTLIPLAVGIFFLMFTSWKVIQAQTEVSLANQTATEAQNTLEGVQADLNSSQATLTPIVGDIAIANQDLATSQAQVASATRALATSQAQVANATRALTTSQAQIVTASRALASAEIQVDAKATELVSLQTQVADYKRLADEAAGFQKYLYTGGIEMIIKRMAGTPPGELLIYLLQLQNKGVSWNARGFSEREGFNSPSLAAYALQRNGLFPTVVTRPISQYELMDILPPATVKLDAGGLPTNLKQGDLVYYPAGYTMFYYIGDDGKPFVIGMTPLGILTLRPDFAQPVGFYRVFQK
jgi:hypothetical protein